MIVFILGMVVGAAVMLAITNAEVEELQDEIDRLSRRNNYK